MLFIRNFIDDPLNWLTSIFGVGSVYFITQIYPIFAKAKYSFTQTGIINTIGFIICILFTLVLFVFSLKDKTDKTRKEIKTLNSKISEQKDSLKQKDENVKGLRQSRTKIKNDIMDSRSTIAALQAQVEIYKEAYKVVLSRTDSKSVLKINEEIISIPETLVSVQKEKQDE